MNHSKCIIILSYIDQYDTDWIRMMAEGASLLLCADGGQEIALRAGLLPDAVIGDFDSTAGDKMPFQDRGTAYVTYPPEKDLTDTEACLLYADDQPFDEILLLGGIGGRLDHTLGNLGLLLKFHREGRILRFLDQKNSIEYLRRGSRRLQRDPAYRYFGLFSVEEKAEGLTILGAKYCLENATLLRASTLGVSNEFAEDAVDIQIRSGGIFIVRSTDFS